MRLSSSKWFALAALCALAPLSAKTLLVLPVAGTTEKASDVEAINQLFRNALGSRNTASIVTLPSADPCGEKACALADAKTAGADQVAYASLYRLGSKLIFTGTVTGADGEGTFTQSLTVASVEDMEAVTRRMADALLDRKSTDEAASVDNITDREETQKSARRKSLYGGGLALGFLFPQGRSFDYLERDDNNPSSQYSDRTFTEAARLTWLNSWEFRSNFDFDVEIAWTIPHTIGGDVNLKYLFGRGDFAPFVGGGLGLEYSHADDDAPADKRDSGPSLNAQAGLVLFRTYDVNVLLRGQYRVLFNSDVDQGFVADIGFVLR